MPGEAETAEDHLARALDAARQEGIQPGTPLGHWMEAMVALTRENGRAMREATDRANQAAQANLAAAEASARRAEAQARQFEAKGEQAIVGVVEKMLPGVIKALDGRLVIRERQRGRWVTLGQLGAGAAVGLALFVAGYWAKAVADRPAVAFHSRCLAAAVRAEGDTRLYCPVDALRDQAVAGQRRWGWER